ncbi:hypothetical protein A1D23_10640 [Chelonobacter oris]|uniref:hypothetical protein n=1 Tax=Chelonobacter oris TaxID=505317 RepID=UPI00244A71B4|nr:hypothetical protein [Chelonobacter oris]MDH3000912.1 hypothetical protein [Chelonobacter oris]
MSRLLVMKTAAAAQSDKLNRALAAFIRQTLQKWPNTVLVEHNLSAETALDCTLLSLQTDYLAWGVCGQDLSADSVFHVYLNLMQCGKNNARSHLTVFTCNVDETEKVRFERQLAELGFRQIAWIESDSVSRAEQQLHEIMRC